MKSKIFLAALVVFFLHGCKNTVDCPGFPEHLADYFPYEAGDTLLFVNQHNDSLMFFSAGVYYTRPHTKTTCGTCAVCESPFLRFKAYESEDDGHIESDFSLGMRSVRFAISFKEPPNDPFYQYVSDNLVTVADEHSADPMKLFGDTITMVKPAAIRITSVIIVKGKGIIKFYDKRIPGYWEYIK